jgi:integrase
MGLGKQAKTLTTAQQNAVLAYLSTTRHPLRNKVIFLLSIRAGLRAKEIASLTVGMTTNATGELDKIALQNIASKGKSGGRVIPLNKELKEALEKLLSAYGEVQPTDRVIQSERSKSVSSQTIVNMFGGWYKELGFDGCSSHSGRRTFITNGARKIGQVGGSLRDIQFLAGHSSLQTTQRYIETNSESHKKIVDII